MNNVTSGSIVIYGASGHGKVIADVVEKSGGRILAFVDDDDARWGKLFFGYPVWEGIDRLIHSPVKDTFSVIIGIGDNRVRWKVRKILKEAGLVFGRAVHPSAQVGKETVIGAGTVIMANAVINAGASIGEHCIVNTSATIDHDCIIGDFVHLSPGAHLGGNVHVGNLSWVGLGASVINNITIGEHCLIGAGAVVIRPIESHTVSVGNPARDIKKNNHKNNHKNN
ncbi:MAG: acetyltransferase [Candidatus Omnitrophota bacterium]